MIVWFANVIFLHRLTSLLPSLLTFLFFVFFLFFFPFFLENYLSRLTFVARIFHSRPKMNLFQLEAFKFLRVFNFLPVGLSPHFVQLLIPTLIAHDLVYELIDPIETRTKQFGWEIRSLFFLGKSLSSLSRILVLPCASFYGLKSPPTKSRLFGLGPMCYPSLYICCGRHQPHYICWPPNAPSRTRVLFFLPVRFWQKNN